MARKAASGHEVVWFVGYQGRVRTEEDMQVPPFGLVPLRWV